MKIRLFFILLMFLTSFICVSQPVDELVSRSSSNELKVKKSIIKINNSIGTLNPFNTSYPFIHSESINLFIVNPEILGSFNWYPYEKFILPKNIFSISYERNLSDALSVEFDLGIGKLIHEAISSHDNSLTNNFESLSSLKYGISLKKYLPFITKKYYPFGFYISPYINLYSIGDNHLLTSNSGFLDPIPIHEDRWKGNLNIFMIGLNTGYQHLLGDIVLSAEFNFSFFNIIKTPKLKKSDFQDYPHYPAITSNEEYFNYNWQQNTFLIPTNFKIGVGYNL